MKLFIQFNSKLKNNNQVKMHYKVPFLQRTRKKNQVIRGNTCSGYNYSE